MGLWNAQGPAAHCRGPLKHFRKERYQRHRAHQLALQGRQFRIEHHRKEARGHHFRKDHQAHVLQATLRSGIPPEACSELFFQTTLDNINLKN